MPAIEYIDWIENISRAATNGNWFQNYTFAPTCCGAQWREMTTWDRLFFAAYNYADESPGERVTISLMLFCGVKLNPAPSYLLNLFQKMTFFALKRHVCLDRR